MYSKKALLSLVFMFKLNKLNLTLFPLTFVLAVICVVLLQWHIDEATAIRWTLWATAAAVVITTIFEFQRRQSDAKQEETKLMAEQEKNIQIALNRLDIKLEVLTYEFHTHERIEGHDGVFLLKGRIAALESKLNINS